jgi:hypothetical protein
MLPVRWEVTPCTVVKRYQPLEEAAASFFRVEEPLDGDKQFLQKIGIYLPTN